MSSGHHSQRCCFHTDRPAHTRTHTHTLQVRMFLGGGAVIDGVTMLEKDNIVYFAFGGEAWRLVAIVRARAAGFLRDFSRFERFFVN